MKSNCEIIFDFVEEQHELFADYLSDEHEIEPSDWLTVVNLARKEAAHEK